MRTELATFEVATGVIDVVFSTERLIEAPNWTPDGKAMIVVSGGRLFRIDLADPAMVEIDTGFASAINNDHGISPDGTMLVIGDSTEEGESCLYTLPAAGGMPRRVTAKVPWTVWRVLSMLQWRSLWAGSTVTTICWEAGSVIAGVELAA